MKVFILEDDPERMRWFREQLYADHTVDVAVSCIEVDKFQPPYDLILLDHDLGGRQMAEHEDCGLTFVNLIKELINPEAFVLIHSYNALGAERMQDALQGAGVENAIYGPFRGHVFNAVLDAAIERGRRALAAK